MQTSRGKKRKEKDWIINRQKAKGGGFVLFLLTWLSFSFFTVEKKKKKRKRFENFIYKRGREEDILFSIFSFYLSFSLTDCLFFFSFQSYFHWLIDWLIDWLKIFDWFGHQKTKTNKNQQMREKEKRIEYFIYKRRREVDLFSIFSWSLSDFDWLFFLLFSLLSLIDWLKIFDWFEKPKPKRRINKKKGGERKRIE